MHTVKHDFYTEYTGECPSRYCPLLGTVYNQMIFDSYNVMKYTTTQEWKYLDYSRELDYNKDGVSYLEKKKIFQYDNSDHALISKIFQIRSNGDTLKTVYKYPLDYETVCQSIYSNCQQTYESCKSSYHDMYLGCVSKCKKDCGDDKDCIEECGKTSSMNYCYTQYLSEVKNFCISDCNSNNNYICQLIDKDINNALLEKQDFIYKNSNYYLTGGELYKYAKFSSYILPSEKYEIKLDSPSLTYTSLTLNTKKTVSFCSYYDKELTYKQYDSYGNLLNYSKENDIENCYLWGYNYTYPVVKIEGKSYSDLDESIRTAISDYSFSNSTLHSDVASDVTWLRNKLSKLLSDNTCKVTFYTYSPLIGMTSQTDPNGVTTYYEYDSFGRLSSIKDDDGNILKTYDYHYKE